MEQDDRRAQHTIKFLYRLCARSESSYARYGLILPFDRAIQEFYTQAKAPSPVFAPGINHSSYLRKLTRQWGNKRFFARPPGSLADYPGTAAVGTDVFRNRSFTGAGSSQVARQTGTEILRRFSISSLPSKGFLLLLDLWRWAEPFIIHSRNIILTCSISVRMWLPRPPAVRVL